MLGKVGKVGKSGESGVSQRSTQWHSGTGNTGCGTALQIRVVVREKENANGTTQLHHFSQNTVI